jgi:hypothetical protein
LKKKNQAEMAEELKTRMKQTLAHAVKGIVNDN